MSIEIVDHPRNTDQKTILELRYEKGGDNIELFSYFENKYEAGTVLLTFTKDGLVFSHPDVRGTFWNRNDRKHLNILTSVIQPGA